MAINDRYDERAAYSARSQLQIQRVKPLGSPEEIIVMDTLYLVKTTNNEQR